jgi:hypothetical protein
MKKYLILIMLLTLSQTVKALPSFTRQTGEACIACHTQAFGPNLNPYGREFKLHGYIAGTGNSLLSRISGMAEGSITNLKRDDPSLGNNNLVLDQASVFFGGRIIDKVGAFVQTTYNGVSNQFHVDNTDIRVTDENEFFGQEFEYGVSFNNAPTSQDLWNTTPAWGFPYASSPVTNNPAAAPLLATLGGQVGGATLYNMFADTLFLEAGAYTSFAKYAQKGMGEWDNTGTTNNSGAVKLNGGAPYWRIALQKEWAGHYFSIGHFGFNATVQPNVTLPGYDKYTDLGTDFNYQYLANPKHIYEVKASYIREHQQLVTTYATGGAAQPNQQLGFLGLNGMYTYDQTYSAALGFNHIYGNQDSIIYSSSPTTMRPNSEYFTFELDYIPFGKTAGSGLSSYMNLKFAAQYIAYTMFDGAIKNYNGTGRNASDNNTLYFNSWLSF